jgi:hypothetical protein
MMRSIAVYLLCAALAGSAFSQAGTPEVSKVVPSFAWPRTEQGSNVDMRVAEEQASALLRTVSTELWGVRVELGQFAFARLWPDRITLVATFDASAWLNSVAALDWDGSRLHVHQWQAWQPYDLNEGVVDVDGDGLVEIVTRVLALGYEGANTKPIAWRAVFKARADYTFEDVSRKNRAYFESRVIPELDMQEAGLGSLYQGTELHDAMAQVQYVRDKYRRLLYGETEAGMENALRWAQDSQRELRILAIEAFRDIETMEAREAVIGLTQSPDRVVAARARDALRAMDLHRK